VKLPSKRHFHPPQGIATDVMASSDFQPRACEGFQILTEIQKLFGKLICRSTSARNKRCSKLTRPLLLGVCRLGPGPAQSTGPVEGPHLQKARPSPCMPPRAGQGLFASEARDAALGAFGMLGEEDLPTLAHPCGSCVLRLFPKLSAARL